MGRGPSPSTAGNSGSCTGFVRPPGAPSLWGRIRILHPPGLVVTEASHQATRPVHLGSYFNMNTSKVSTIGQIRKLGAGEVKSQAGREGLKVKPQ